MHILIIEDETELRQGLQQQLGKAGYQITVSANGTDGLYLAREYPFSGAVIDLGLPGLSGLDIIRHLRSEGNKLPILILTARGRWQERVEGLEAGADDYLVKPFQMEELLARVRALVRRATAAGLSVIRAGPLAVNINTQRVSLEGKEIELTTLEYKVLEYLVQHQGQVVSKFILNDYLYPMDQDPESNVLEVMLGRIRRKLDPTGQCRIIETVRGRGYRLKSE